MLLTAEAFLSGAVCAASFCTPFCLCPWVTILVCIGSSPVRDRGVSGVAQVHVEKIPVGLLLAVSQGLP